MKITIDSSLVNKAQRLGRHRTKVEAVNVALNDYVRRLQQQKIIFLFGTIDYDGDFDYRKARRRKRN